MNEKLYFVANEGCDDVTRGIVSVSDSDFPKFKALIENLNKNSTYGCMPTISVYKINREQIKEIVYDPNKRFGHDDYVERCNVFYFEGKTYTFAEENFWYHGQLEQVIGVEL